MKMTYLPSYGTLFSLWFSLTWRTFAWMIPAIIVSLILSFFIGFIAALAGVEDPNVLQPVSFVIGALGGLFAFLQALKGVFGKTFNGYTLALIKDDETV